MDRGAWWAAVHGVTKESDMTERTHTQPNALISMKKSLCPVASWTFLFLLVLFVHTDWISLILNVHCK